MKKTDQPIVTGKNNPIPYRKIRWKNTPQARRILLVTLFLWITILAIHPNTLLAQAIPHVRITGIVTDASTGKPLHSVNVFLANTTLGCATDENGLYVIAKVPLGNYDLIASMMGYELKEESIRLTESTDRVFNVKLRPKILMGEEITIVVSRPHEWKKNLKKFEGIFLGTSENASQCEILNPEVIDFKSDDTRGIFRASTNQPLQLENRALGYRIDFTLRDFTFYQNGSVNFLGRARYEPLFPKDEREEKKWIENRLEAYHGSLRHFLVAAISNHLWEEGFLAYNVSALPGSSEEIFFGKAKVEHFISAGAFPFERTLIFPHYLKVIYTKESVSREYIWYNIGKTSGLSQGSGAQGKGGEATEQTSWLEINLKPVTINISGHVYNPYSITTYGYWAWERVAEQLPLDYLP